MSEHMSNDLKPGDRALVAFSRASCQCRDSRLGEVVVLGARYVGLSHCPYCGGIDECDGFWLAGEFAVRPSSCLIPLPPDDEAKRLFRETDAPKRLRHAGAI